MSGAPFIVGLTGGIGSGKTTVSRCFEALGVTVIDSDQIAHQLTGAAAREGVAMRAIRAHFGPQMVRADGALNRALMRQLVFSDEAARTTLEALLHPLIRQEMQRQSLAAQARHAPQTPYQLWVIPLLTESWQKGQTSWHDAIARVLLVDCAEATQCARVQARNGFALETVQAIMARQATRAARLALAHDCIDTDRIPEADLPATVRDLDARYRALAQHHHDRT